MQAQPKISDLFCAYALVSEKLSHCRTVPDLPKRCVRPIFQCDLGDDAKVAADDAVDGITKQEFAILELLMAHPRQVFAKEDIFEYAWDEPYIGETKTLDVHISNIRKKIKRLTDDEYIETVWGIGYKMKE